jgi:hypothetical protein
MTKKRNSGKRKHKDHPDRMVMIERRGMKIGGDRDICGETHRDEIQTPRYTRIKKHNAIHMTTSRHVDPRR